MSNASISIGIKLVVLDLIPSWCTVSKAPPLGALAQNPHSKVSSRVFQTPVPALQVPLFRLMRACTIVVVKYLGHYSCLVLLYHVASHGPKCPHHALVLGNTFFRISYSHNPHRQVCSSKKFLLMLHVQHMSAKSLWSS